MSHLTSAVMSEVLIAHKSGTRRLGCSLFDAAAKALEFFCGPNWKGPRPRRNTVLNVTILGDHQRYRVLAGRIERCARRSSRLAD